MRVFLCLPVEVADLLLPQDTQGAWWVYWVCCTDSPEMVWGSSTEGWPAYLSKQGWSGASPTLWWCCYMGNLYKWEKQSHGIKRKSVEDGLKINTSICYGDSLQGLIRHAAGSKAWLVQQHISKVSHLSIHRMLITAKDKKYWVSYFPQKSYCSSSPNTGLLWKQWLKMDRWILGWIIHSGEVLILNW